ncbi:MAG: PqiA/YebS family transporter subunit [Succinivibrio sp.]
MKDKKVVCNSCDMTVLVQDHDRKSNHICPRCGKKLLYDRDVRVKDVALVAFGALIFLCISIVEPFMSISSMGLKSGMSLYSIVSILNVNWGLLLLSFLVFTFFAPVSVLVIITLVGIFGLRPTHLMCKIYGIFQNLCMVDVFVLGVAVSLIKLTSLADVSFYTGFYTTLVFSVLMIWCCIKVNAERLWEMRMPQQDLDVPTGVIAKDYGYKCCRECGYVFKSSNEEKDICPRCGSKVTYREKQYYSKCLSLLISAVILYLPSNLYPVMYTEFIGSTTGSNIIEGVIAMWNMNSYFVAAVILIASIFIPAFKILAMGFILYVTKHNRIKSKKKISLLYRFVIVIGRWSMIDVYVVIIMSAIVKINSILNISPGFAIICFCSVVLITLFSAESFDERLIWDQKEYE